MITSLINIFGIKGLLYGIMYVLITKGIYLFFLSIFIMSLIKIANLFIKRIFSGERISKDNLSLLLKRIFICIAAILISDIILYFGGAKLITIFNFLL